MFIYNFKLNSSKFYKFIFVLIILFVLILCGIVCFKLYKASFKVDDEIKAKKTNQLNNKNYASILKLVHENPDEYIGQKIKYSGYVYRVYDLDNDQFVLARNMIISSDMQTVIVGFLCHLKNADKYVNNSWVEIEATINKCNYHGDMPILEIDNIRKIDKPDDEYVYPPDDSYIETSILL